MLSFVIVIERIFPCFRHCAHWYLLPFTCVNSNRVPGLRTQLYMYIFFRNFERPSETLPIGSMADLNRLGLYRTWGFIGYCSDWNLLTAVFHTFTLQHDHFRVALRSTWECRLRHVPPDQSEVYIGCKLLLNCYQMKWAHVPPYTPSTPRLRRVTTPPSLPRYTNRPFGHQRRYTNRLTIH